MRCCYDDANDGTYHKQYNSKMKLRNHFKRKNYGIPFQIYLADITDIWMEVEQLSLTPQIACS